eukprot:2340611-Rhodomonas_salina.1
MKVPLNGAESAGTAEGKFENASYNGRNSYEFLQPESPFCQCTCHGVLLLPTVHPCTIFLISRATQEFLLSLLLAQRGPSSW